MYELKILKETDSVLHFAETRNNVETRNKVLQTRNFTSLPLTLAAGFELSGVRLYHVGIIAP